MSEQESLASLAGRFEEQRPRLRAVAYRMLGSLGEAEDAVQEAWLRLSRADVSEVRNLGGWLTTVVGRVCLDMLRSRTARREEPMPDPVLSGPGGVEPEQRALVADEVGIALMIVLGTLAPAERLAFVLHDLFAVPFDEIAEVLGRSPAAVRQLASRARRRVEGAAPAPDTDAAHRRAAVDAFLAAARNGDFEALLAVLDPDVVVRADGGALGPSSLRRGARNVASGAATFGPLMDAGLPVLVNGQPGVLGLTGDEVRSVVTFSVSGGRISAIYILNDPERLRTIDVESLR
ncbi:sigma-70 family RNA polymerase sigma factor [Streptomyces sp. 8K308]|uniref:sigma-70 family RNA polymerase sigma factor n=1 Tax=Streptomyces sp. 8K308 TaxID=2530388 RepID=UPI001048D0FD|nr:sigma-70 family RNA polymerase sigma factor [Streptomyces sp. 8K308]TDC21147.1 sigma-70 family RNA polymerase sigma factor [Streptomyces sp. 8K308]